MPAAYQVRNSEAKNGSRWRTHSSTLRRKYLRFYRVGVTRAVSEDDVSPTRIIIGKRWRQNLQRYPIVRTLVYFPIRNPLLNYE